MLLHYAAAYLGIVLLVLSPARAIVFLAVHMGLFRLYLGCTFALNHKGMPMLADTDQRPTFLRRQVLTSRNVRGGPLVDVLLGGLSYQIEHHLFPNMAHPAPAPRPSCGTTGPRSARPTPTPASWTPTERGLRYLCAATPRGGT